MVVETSQIQSVGFTGCSQHSVGTIMLHVGYRGRPKGVAGSSGGNFQHYGCAMMGANLYLFLD